MNGAELMIKVSPAELSEKALEILARVKLVEQRFRQIEQSVIRSNGYWNGEAGELHRQVYQEQQDEREEILRRLREEVEDLQQIAGNYSESERQIKEMTSSLPDNIII